MTTQGPWRKSSRSTNTSTCVEVSRGLEKLRDSKDPTGATLRVDVAEFVRAVKLGRFDR